MAKIHDWERLEDAPTFEKIIRQKPPREYEERVTRHVEKRKHVPREDKE